MEAVGSAAAILQLVQALGTTVVKVHQAYTEINCMQDLLHDFDTQLDGTRMIISILGDGIEKGSFGTSTQGWWRQSELERLLRSCHQSYQRLNDIFINIARQRSSAAALRAWGRMKFYEADISHLRLCINTCTDALQLPIILYKIHTSVHIQDVIPAETRVPDLLEEVVSRLASLETSMTHTKEDLVKRALQRSQAGQPSTSQATKLQDMIEGIENEISDIAASRLNNLSTASDNQIELRLAQIQSRLSQLQFDVGPKEEDVHPVPEPREGLETMEMENDTRTMLSAVDDLVGSVRDYTSTMDGMSTISKNTSKPPKKGKNVIRNLEPRIDEDIDLSLDLPPVQLPKEKQQGISEWVNHVDGDDEGSSDTSGSTLSRSTSPKTVTTQSEPTTMSGESFFSEMRERRIRAIEEMMRAKEYNKAIPHLEHLLGNGTEPRDAEEDARLLECMAKAIAEGGSDKEDALYQNFPPLRTKVEERRYRAKLKQDRLNLKRATEALDRGCHDDVVDILWPYLGLDFETGDDITQFFQGEQETGDDINQFPQVERETAKRIGLALGQSLFYAQSYWNISVSVGILEQVLKGHTLGLSDKRVVHYVLAQAYYWKTDYRKCKLHCIEAFKLMTDTLGRDDAMTQDAIALMAQTCSETQDPDVDLWNQMLSESTAIQFPTKKAFQVSEALKSSPGAVRLAHVRSKNKDEPVNVRQYVLINPFMNSVAIGFPQNSHIYPCENHNIHTIRIAGCSSIHLFSMSNPKLNNNDWSDAEGPDCIEEISLLLWDAKEYKMPPELEWSNFGLFDLINSPMDIELPRKLNEPRRDLIITPVWAAALSGNKSTVSFFVSLRETDVTRGSNSIVLLRRPQKEPKYRLGKSDRNQLENLLGAVFEAFNALPVPTARDLLSCALKKYDHWCFVDPTFLEKVLQKCGADSADLCTRFLLPLKTSTSTSLLSTFLFLMEGASQAKFDRVSQKDLKDMLASLLSHSQEFHRESAFRNKSIGTLISHIEVALGPPDSISLDYFSRGLEENVKLWIDMIRMCTEHGPTIDTETSLKLRQCIIKYEGRISAIKERLMALLQAYGILEEELKEIKRSEKVLSRLRNWSKKPPNGTRLKIGVESELDILKAKIFTFEKNRDTGFKITDSLKELLRSMGASSED
ncbi:hypothetical protein F53441_7690 [Fusarium austroafricanum]|uniref:Fungal N-terminal domain-containing protein n=1 Tax=Fusarium austroafricanum TaxID=2364996 RepID=A0A8H4NVA1_9HYPO|nr:hypothetical protein F53441_7690 [Fusarium austroafricanum]